MVTEFTGNLLMRTLALKTCWQGGHQGRAKSHSNNGLTRGKRHNKPLQWTAFPLRFINFEFFEQRRKLKGLHDEINVWVSKEIASQFLTREDIRLTPEVHIAGICVKKEHNTIKALIAKRNSNRKLFPNLYEGCGGQLDRDETFVTGVKRHYKLELKVDVDAIEDIHKFYQAVEKVIFSQTRSWANKSKILSAGLPRADRSVFEK